MVCYTLTSPVNLPESVNYLYFVVNFGQQGQQKKGTDEIAFSKDGKAAKKLSEQPKIRYKI